SLRVIPPLGRVHLDLAENLGGGREPELGQSHRSDWMMEDVSHIERHGHIAGAGADVGIHGAPVGFLVVPRRITVAVPPNPKIPEIGPAAALNPARDVGPELE